MIRCGKCKDAHATVADVRACYFPTPDITIPNGTYTVWMADTERHFTLRFKPDFRPGHNAQVVEYLHGPDNTTDFTGCAFFDRGTVIMWRKYTHSDLRRKIELAVSLLAGDPAAGQHAYAMRSSRCGKCNRKLTVPASLFAGLGPECAKKVA